MTLGTVLCRDMSLTLMWVPFNSGYSLILWFWVATWTVQPELHNRPGWPDVVPERIWHSQEEWSLPNKRNWCGQQGPGDPGHSWGCTLGDSLVSCWISIKQTGVGSSEQEIKHTVTKKPLKAWEILTPDERVGIMLLFPAIVQKSWSSSVQPWCQPWCTAC